MFFPRPSSELKKIINYSIDTIRYLMVIESEKSKTNRFRGELYSSWYSILPIFHRYRSLLLFLKFLWIGNRATLIFLLLLGLQKAFLIILDFFFFRCSSKCLSNTSHSISSHISVENENSYYLTYLWITFQTYVGKVQRKIKEHFGKILKKTLKKSFCSNTCTLRKSFTWVNPGVNLPNTALPLHHTASNDAIAIVYHSWMAWLDGWLAVSVRLVGSN